MSMDKVVYAIFLIFLIIYMYMGLFGNYQIADHMAKNPKNIIKSCMYFVSYSKSRHTYVTKVNIDGGVYETYLIYARKSDMYLSDKYGEFNRYIRDNPNICHPVGYVELINLGFYKKIFVYHYYGDFQLSKP